MRKGKIKAGKADEVGERETFAVEQLVVVRRMGEAIYPAQPHHVLIEADNYHALQLLLFPYENKVDCIYIDPPYNTGARDWKYNNDYVDKSDGWRHSKWLTFMKKRLKMAMRLLRPDNSVLVGAKIRATQSIVLVQPLVHGRLLISRIVYLQGLVRLV